MQKSLILSVPPPNTLLGDPSANSRPHGLYSQGEQLRSKEIICNVISWSLRAWEDRLGGGIVLPVVRVHCAQRWDQTWLTSLSLMVGHELSGSRQNLTGDLICVADLQALGDLSSFHLVATNEGRGWDSDGAAGVLSIWPLG